MTLPQKAADLRALGDYSDEYFDEYSAYTDRIAIVPSQHRLYYREVSEGWIRVSSLFLYSGELAEHPDIWTAAAPVWDDRGAYSTIEALRAAMDAALAAGGYAFPS